MTKWRLDNNVDRHRIPVEFLKEHWSSRSKTAWTDKLSGDRVDPPEKLKSPMAFFYEANDIPTS